MFRNVRVPILGIIENMSYYQCPNCGHQQHIFGRDGAKRTAEDFNMELLGQVISCPLRGSNLLVYSGINGTALQPRESCCPIPFKKLADRYVSHHTSFAMAQSVGIHPLRKYPHVQVPLEMSIRESSDAGSPIVVSQVESREAQVYAKIAARVKQKLDRYADLQTDQQEARAKA